MNKSIRLSGIAYESLVNGPGIRRVFFAQGCNHNCRGCFNPDTHDFMGGEEMDMDLLIKDLSENPFIDGVTFSGGDPLEQSVKFLYLAKESKKLGLNVWSYTGYRFEYLLENANEENKWKEYLENIDVLVDGKFEINNKQDGLRFRGSTNQRIIDVKKSLEEGMVVQLEF
ncbi:anaerobic ribonucleoside-triphosphate reductase activating protein [Clostridium sp. B9]|uniref:anaerobic ribonucleoside-triphosphate reductase activating protein n=1 Tax=Clostridium sp. B9 TaxID=3423224 RepID=UPI003D2F185B